MLLVTIFRSIGRTIAAPDATEAEEVLKRWLRHEIDRLDGELAA